MATFERYAVVVVPFPLTDRTTAMRRPALVLSGAEAFDRHVDQSVLAMITSAKHSAWPLDVEIGDLDAAGLPTPSIVRMKLFTLDHRLILRTLGALAPKDARAVRRAVRGLLG